MRSLCLIVLAALLSTAASAAAREASPEMRAIVAGLSSPDAAERDAADAVLRTLVIDDLPDLCEAVAALPEPRPRRLVVPLRRAVENAHVLTVRRMVEQSLLHVLKERTAFFGISQIPGPWVMERFDNFGNEWIDPDRVGEPLPGVVISEPLLGFPSFAAVRDGDVVIEVMLPPGSRLGPIDLNGPPQGWVAWRIDDFYDFMEAVSFAVPGRPVVVRVLRGGRFVDATVELCNFTPRRQDGWAEVEQEARSRARAAWDDRFAALFAADARAERDDEAADA